MGGKDLMKEAPEKLYVDTDDRLSDSILYCFTEKRKDDDIEYVRKDVFIEKACDFIKANIDHYIGHYLNDDDTYLDNSFIEDFKKYMED